MNQNDHALGVGKIINNLEALELVIRIFLGNANNQKLEYPKLETKELPETYVTNFMSLDELVSEYNAGLYPAEQVHSVDTEAIKIRDAFAHGRIYSLTVGFPIELYKFAKPKDGKAAVEFAESLTADWLKQKNELIRAQMDKVVNCGKGRKYKSFGG